MDGHMHCGAILLLPLVQEPNFDNWNYYRRNPMYALIPWSRLLDGHTASINVGTRMRLPRCWVVARLRGLVDENILGLKNAPPPLLPYHTEEWLRAPFSWGSGVHGYQTWLCWPYLIVLAILG